MSIFKEDLVSKETCLQDLQTMNNFGIRITGTKGQADYVAWLKDQIKALGLEVKNKEYKFDRWEDKDVALTVDGKPMHVTYAFPYSGLTGEEGVTGKLVKVHNTPIGFSFARGNIGVLRIKDLGSITTKIAFNMRNSFPQGTTIDPYYKGPVATSFMKTLLTFWAAKFSGMKAMICIWENISDAMAEGQWLNFILDYLKVPMVWVNDTDGKALLKACKEKKTATVKLTGRIEKDAKTESFYTIIKGTDTTNNEALIINTHTDGCNFVEENGGIGMLEMIKYFVKHPTKRTLIFVFVTGHFRLPVFRVGHLTSNQATGRWLDENRDVWKKQYNAVAGVCVEHLGCTEWKDRNGVYTKTNDIDLEIVYTGNKNMDKIYYEAIKDRKMVRTVTVRTHNTMHFGEGQTLNARKVPEIALVTAPDYLCSVDPTGNHHMDKFNLDLMAEQIESFINIVNILDVTDKKVLGKPQGTSLGLGKIK